MGGGGELFHFILSKIVEELGELIRRRAFKLGGFSYILPLMELKFIFA